ncbi:hypothetical protein E2562_022402 [Oryza meyeriana var. granulata]|uniref:Protein kinase domain-containing protein n=1 Tax=Oryza meyeriana var. granulata TaxID=110450 RepID=A0A6G1EY54_9ORYZ|nr:hypothetical protein E2562_022402 [Oryza meyeriana var. granulata]
MEKVGTIKIFSKDDLKKITKNNSEVLGQGGFGKVYKGTLEDNTFVAVKTSIEKAYDQENSGRAMFDKSIAIEENIFMLEEIGKLAMECLKEKVEERPDMKEVAERLVMLRRSRKHGQGNYILSAQHFEEISIEGAPKGSGAEISASSSATVSAPATPAN